MIRYAYRIAVAGPSERKRKDWVFGWDYPNFHLTDRVSAQKLAKKLNKMHFKTFGEQECKYKAFKMHWDEREDKK